MATQILNTEDIDSTLEEVILEKTEGIPFFVEEFIKSLKDLGFIERKNSTYRISKELQTIHIPSSIQDIIMSRVDALPEGAKELLQMGSLIGREFSYRLIKTAMHLPDEELLRSLSFLKDAELLYERGLFPDSNFIFKHALTREVVYETLLERRKKELHVDIGKAIEEIYKNNLEEMFSALAGHFEQGNDYEKAIQYFRLAQKRARRTSAYNDAIAFSRKRVACLEKLPNNVEVQKRVIDARVSQANYCLMLNHYVEAKDTIFPIFDLVHQLDYRKSLPTIYVIMAAYLQMIEERHNEAETSRYLMEAQRIALEEKDYLSLWNAYYYEGLAYGSACEFAKGESCYLRIIEMSKEAGSVTGLVLAKSTLTEMIYALSGRIEEALRCGQEALHLAFQAEDLYLKGAACTSAFLRKGLFPEAEENLTLAVEANKKTDFNLALLWSFRYLGLLRSEMGRYQEALACWEGLQAVCERTKIYPSFARLAQIQKVAVGVRGRRDPAHEGLLNFDLQEIRIRPIQGHAAHGMGEIYLYLDDSHMDEAETWIRKAVEVDERNQMPWELARDYALYAEFFKKKGDSVQAKEKLGKAIELMRGCNAEGWVGKYEKELVTLS